ncbi:MAG: hypothetical protein ACR2K5_16870 [Pseudolabrys sp.]
MKRRSFVSGALVAAGFGALPANVRAIAPEKSAGNIAKARPFIIALEDKPDLLLQVSSPSELIARKRAVEFLATKTADIRGYRAIKLDLVTGKQHGLFARVEWSKRLNEESDPSLGAHRIRVWAATQAEGQKLKDSFVCIPVPPNVEGATIVFFGLNSENSPGLENVSVYGYRGIETAGNEFEIELTPGSRQIARPARAPADNPILASGVKITLTDVSAAEYLDRTHRWQPLSAAMTFGSMHPNCFTINPGAGSKLLWFGGDDMVIAACDAEAKILEIEIFDFHLCEHHLLVEGQVKTVEQASEIPLLRENPNLGLRVKDAPAEMMLGCGGGQYGLSPCWQPNGCVATVILTEHADFQEVETDLVVFYGSAELPSSDGRGMAAYGLPMTKTIFITGNDYSFVNVVDGAEVQFTQQSYLGNAQFKALIDSYIEKHVPFEFGLHTAGTRSHTAAEAAGALQQCGRLNLKVWTDHGAVESDIMRSGWNSAQPDHYILDLLRQYRIFTLWADGDYLSGPGARQDYNLVRENSPSPILFSADGLNAPDQTKPFSVFTTLPGPLEIQLTGAGLQKLVADRGITITHSYLAYSLIDFSGSTKEHRKMNLKPEALTLFQELSDSRAKGDLHVTTIAAWRDYIDAMRSLQIVGQPETAFEVRNPGAEIKGATFVCAPRQIVDALPKFANDRGVEIASRNRDGQTYFWLDLPSGSTAIRLTL